MNQTIFNAPHYEFQVGQKNVIHVDYGPVEIDSINTFYGMLMYGIRVISNNLCIWVVASRLEVKA